MTDDMVSRVMFWVGLMFVLTPLVVIAAVVLTTRRLRKKRSKTEPQRTP